MSSLVRLECQQKDFLKSTSFRVPKGLRAPASQKQGSGVPSKVDRAPGLQDSNFIIIIIIIIIIQI